jgi:cyclopropane fatty-acyl-phospholipid synthase-like methyltransferase
MSELQEKLARSFTADTVELLPYLPYLLQDLWELGSSPKDMIKLMSKHITMSKDIKILDLACGKGAVSINVAKEFGCRVVGIDLIPEFIEEAKKKAEEHHVASLCRFRIGDINQAVKTERGYDIVILGAVGSVLGNQEKTLHQLSRVIKKNGYALLDDGYATEEGKDGYLTRPQWLDVIHKTGFKMIEDLPVDDAEFSKVLTEQMTFISKRVNELKDKIPSKSHLFDEYMASQLAECDELESELKGVTMLLRKIK